MVHEKDMNNSICKYFDKYKSYNEIPIGKRHIDWLFIKGNEIIAVELKVNNWKNVFRQALSNTFCSHKSYIGIWHKTYKNINLNLFKKYGIGILSVNENVIEKIKPEIQNNEITSSMKMILKYINGVEE